MTLRAFTAMIDIPDNIGASIVYSRWKPFIGGVISESGQAYSSQTGHAIKTSGPLGAKMELWVYTQFSDAGVIEGQVCLKNFPVPTINAEGFFTGLGGYFSNFSPSGQISCPLIFHAGGAQTSALLFALDQGKYENPRPLMRQDFNNHTQLMFYISYPIDIA
jgi:hypothetical protein